MLYVYILFLIVILGANLCLLDEIQFRYRKWLIKVMMLGFYIAQSWEIWLVVVGEPRYGNVGIITVTIIFYHSLLVKLKEEEKPLD